LIFRWRKQFSAEAPAASSERAGETSFMPVALPAPLMLQTSSPPARDGIEIVLACGHRVIVGRHFDFDTLKRVVEALKTA
jgi:hypothetical protein